MADLPPCPASLKPIAHYLKCAQEHDTRDPVVSYWARLYAVQTGLKLSTKQPDETNLLIAIMGWLEMSKKENAGNEAISSEVVAQAHLENYAYKLFNYADQQDLASNFGKNVVKAFYTSGLIYDILLTFGELSDEAQKNSKYAKWKAAYIHNCLKNGETPIPGPMKGEGDEEDELGAIGGSDGGTGDVGGGFQQPPPPRQPPAEIPPPSLPSPSSSGGDPTHPVIGFGQIPVDYDANKLPSPPVDPEIKNPGGFQPYVPSAQPIYQPPVPVADVNLTPDQMTKAQKYCKWAVSALNYDDIKSAVDNLQKALTLLQTGRDSA